MAKVENRHVTIKDLQRAGIPVKPASAYVPKAWRRRKPVSLERVHAILSKVKGNLADEIARTRENGLW